MALGQVILSISDARGSREITDDAAVVLDGILIAFALERLVALAVEVVYTAKRGGLFSATCHQQRRQYQAKN
jgi:hypothetical protein